MDLNIWEWQQIRKQQKCLAKAFEYDWYSDFCKSSVCAAVLKLVMNMI